ncbi:hypothetical protein [Natrinema salifodinae]|uniref:DUF8107 domain-containing protein n=1 Tax=Natrinema salifodinae TaxID=1202768 RepID=A0A1I0PAT3_9EURY|nr:hypothetical protein [Natrinema salifodinae]SEW11482.1 hypothetical protein SAMN05216285_2360 [Natrinema salifodinae]
MSGPDDEREHGLQEGLESSEGDPRVLLLLNAALSTLFALVFVYGASLIDLLPFLPRTVIAVALGVFLLTHVVSKP